jgi:hypothetical protein
MFYGINSPDDWLIDLPSYGFIPALSLELLFRLAGIHVPAQIIAGMTFFLIRFTSGLLSAFQDQKTFRLIKKRTKACLRLYNQAGFNTIGAGPDAHGLAVFDGPNLLEIGVPAFLGLIVGMADLISHNRSFPANITHFGHG